MSVKIMGQVWELDLPHNEVLVLLAMADHADHDGTGVRPSVDLIAWKCGYEERQVRRIQARLRERGILVLVEDRRAQNAPHLYRIDLEKAPRKEPLDRMMKKGGAPVKKSGTPPVIKSGGEKGGNGKMSGEHRTYGRPGAPDIQVSDESSGTRHEDPSNKHSAAAQPGRGPDGDRRKGGGGELGDGTLLGLVRKRLYVNGRPPAGYDEGRDMGIIRALQERRPGCGYTRTRIADAIEGLALLRAAGELVVSDGHGGTRVVGAEEPLTLRIVYHADHGVRPLFLVAEERAIAAQAPKRATAAPAVRRPSGLTALADALGGAVLPLFEGSAAPADRGGQP